MQQGGVSCVFRFVSNSRFEKGEGQLDEGDEFSIGRKGARRKRHWGWLNGYRHRERRKPLEPATKVCTRLILNVNLHHICMHHRAYPRLTRSTPGLNTSLIAVYISPPVHAAMPVPLRPGHVWNLVIRRLILSLSFRIRRRVPFICYYYRTFRIFIRIEDSMGFLTNLFHCNHCATLSFEIFLSTFYFQSYSESSCLILVVISIFWEASIIISITFRSILTFNRYWKMCILGWDDKMTRIVAFDFNDVTNIYIYICTWKIIDILGGFAIISIVGLPIGVEKCVHDLIESWRDPSSSPSH